MKYMNYPDSCDPIYQAERREDEWERTLQSCTDDRCCVLIGKGTAVALCGDCIDDLTAGEENYEVEPYETV